MNARPKAHAIQPIFAFRTIHGAICNLPSVPSLIFVEHVAICRYPLYFATFKRGFMIKKQIGTIAWYEFEILQPFPYLRHGCFPSLNIANDGQPETRTNRQMISSLLFGNVPFIEVNQVHGTDIAIIASSPPEGSYDGMATLLCNTPLLIRHADCQACLLFDPEHQVIGAIHCGWRGNVKNFYSAAVSQLRKQYGTKPESLLACLSPSLGECHSQFTNWKEEFPPSFELFRKPNDYFDLLQISRHQLLACGLSSSHIEVAGICTYCHPEEFFSYRRDKTSMRNATCIAMAKPVDYGV
jgi:polyphenol oxidase